MPLAHLSIGTTTNRINLLNPGGFMLYDWRVGGYEPDGIWQESQLADFRQLAAYRDVTVIERFELVLKAAGQDHAARLVQEMRAMLRLALDFWATTWQTNVVYLAARASCETNMRYAIVYDARLVDESNPLGQPFVQYGNSAVMDELALFVERGPWLENAPGTGTGVYIGTTQTYDGRTVGNVDDTGTEELSTANRTVFAANKHNIAQLTDIWRWIGAGWDPAGNLMDAALPYNIASWRTGTQDFTLFGIDNTVADSGPFCSLIFDIGTAQNNLDLEWRYSQGGPDPDFWPVLTVQDNTNQSGLMGLGPLSTTGIGSVHWVQPSDWSEQDPQVGAGAALGITGYWVCLYDTFAGPAAALISTQQHRDVYTVTWPYVDVDADQVAGDMPALLRLGVDTRSAQDGLGTTTDLWCQRILAGLRSYDRGANFSAYINISDEQMPTGATLARTGSMAAFAAEPRAPTGRTSLYNPGGALAMAQQIRISLSSHWYGRFHAFLRGIQLTGNAGEILVQLRYSPQDAYYGGVSTITRAFTSTTAVQALDLGEITLGPDVDLYPFDMQNTHVDIWAESTAAATCYFYDLILIPVDEWAIDSEDMFKNVGAPIYTNDIYSYLNIDAISNQRKLLSHLILTSLGTVYRYWRPITNGVPILQSGKHQRFWLFSSRFDDYADADDPRAEHELCAGTQVWKNQRYTTLRGDQ